MFVDCHDLNRLNLNSKINNYQNFWFHNKRHVSHLKKRSCICALCICCVNVFCFFFLSFLVMEKHRRIAERWRNEKLKKKNSCTNTFKQNVILIQYIETDNTIAAPQICEVLCIGMLMPFLDIVNQYYYLHYIRIYLEYEKEKKMKFDYAEIKLIISVYILGLL